MKNSDFQQNVVIVTGASSGIGEALAYQLADQGARLSLAARSVEQLEAVAAECRQRGGRCLVVPTDVSEESQCRELVSQTFAEYGRIETLFNNAGISMWAIFARLQELDFLEQLMRVNYFGSVYCTYYALPYLKETKGRIVGVSSLAGKTGLPTRTGYAASKHAQVGFFDSLRIEVAPYGVSVTLA
jgi:NAD(P)-dependent dehydrogenase (short-subunit alcohol dehydrogenase family)